MPKSNLVFGFIVLVVVAGMTYAGWTAVRRQLYSRQFVSGSARVLDVRRQGSDEEGARYVVKAEISARDGRRATNWSASAHGFECKRWVGSSREAWHHPVDLEEFVLNRPRGMWFLWAQLLVLATGAITIILVAYSVM